jgi:hypothetical protein
LASDGDAVAALIWAHVHTLKSKPPGKSKPGDSSASNKAPSQRATRVMDGEEASCRLRSRQPPQSFRIFADVRTRVLRRSWSAFDVSKTKRRRPRGATPRAIDRVAGASGHGW